ncbi:glycosyl hydrolase family 28-related protein [Paenibacillus sp. S-38]|uniref:glycosyl hydrolase family 28-related protein n=1 Tax=Paenibacillus sp. S-38 TaxID=3416710 RepID=UPI003CEF508B
MINVVEQGAVVGGKEDCTAAFQRAIDQARETGEKIKVPLGPFLIKGQLSRLDNVFFEGTASNKQYWPEYGDFYSGASVLVGANSNVLFAADITRATIDNLCFANFAKIAEKSSPRSMRFRNCSFKDMVVLDAPSGEKGSYHNYRFFGCDFTNYGVDAIFKGRIIDSVWKDCTFVGASAFDLVQAKANLIAHNRFEWIDRSFAMALFACEYNQIIENFFDRVAGNAIILKQLNKHVHIAENLFNRCGSGLKSTGLAFDPPLPEKFLSHIQLFGEYEGVSIQNNVFCRGPVSDKVGGELAPKYVLTKEANTGNCNVSFKGNTYDCGCTNDLIYVEGDKYERIQLDTDSVFGELTSAVVSLSKVSSGRITTYNDKKVTVKEIPENLIVHNAGGEISFEAGGAQRGVVYGGRVGGRGRFTRDKMLMESLDYIQVTGGAAWRKLVYSIPVSRAMAGAPITFLASYRTNGTPDLTAEVVGEDGKILRKLKSLTPTASNLLYREVFTVPAGYAGTVIKVVLYCTRTMPLTTGSILKIDAVTAGYGYATSDAFADKL